MKTPSSGVGPAGCALSFRPDIEGLRALAILPILLFHLGVPGFGGGFVGVDVFFVISGYLLTAILLRGGWSSPIGLAEFYRRRLVRVLPALLVMLALVVAASALLLLPGELAATGRSGASAALMTANLWFWTQVGYFAPLAQGQPLLHTWSLGVEEQFYLLYPLLLVAARRRPEMIIGLVTAASFALAVWWTARDDSAGFYLLPARAWQLGAGGLIAVGVIRIDRYRGLAASTGLGLILLSSIGAGAVRNLPLPAGTLATLGAVLVIAPGSGTASGRLLARAPLRAIGARSYSLYLWHWPIIVLWRLWHGETLPPAAMLGLAVATAVSAELSYRLVERPGRRRGRRGRPGGVIGLALLGMVAVAGFVLLVAHYQRPLPPAVARIARYAAYDATAERRFQYRTGHCFLEGGGALDPVCATPVADRPNQLLIGDSHAAMLWRALAERDPGVNLLQVTVPGCRPLFAGPGKAACTSVIRTALARARDDRRIGPITLVGRWQAADLAALSSTIRALRVAGHPVFVIGSVVEYDGAFPGLLARAMLAGQVAGFDHFRLREPGSLDRRMAWMVALAGGRYLSAQAAECAGGCRLVTPDGQPLHSDYGHYTLAGARWIADRLPAIR